MITNFEDVTAELTDEELAILPHIISGFQSHDIEHPIKAPAIVKSLNAYLQANDYKLKITDARLRKYCNYIRTHSLIPLIATSKGYYTSTDSDVIVSQIRSLRERAASIRRCADGLLCFIPVEARTQLEIEFP